MFLYLRKICVPEQGKTNKSEVYDDQHAISPEQIHFTPVNPNDN